MRILPTSYTLSPHLLNIHPQPFTFGGFSDVYHGTFSGSRVCIKRVRVYVQETQDNPEKALKVRYRLCYSPPPLLMGVAGLLPRGRGVETYGTLECCSPPGNHHLPAAPTDFGLDVRRRSVEIHQEKSRCRSPWARGCPSRWIYRTLTPVTSFATLLMASTTSIRAM